MPGLHVTADLLIWLAFLVIPVVLAYFLFRRRDVPFPRMFALFAAVIVCCGTTFLADAAAAVAPNPWLPVAAKLATAAVAWGAVARMGERRRCVRDEAMESSDEYAKGSADRVG